MKPNSFTLEVINSSFGPLYRVVTSAGAILIETYILAAASICLDALNQRYPAS